MTTNRDPKIYIIEVLHKNPYKHPSVVGEYVLDAELGSATFLTTKDIDCATAFRLDQACTICSNFNKTNPEFFNIRLKPTFNVPIEYGKNEYTIASKLNDL